MKRRAGANTRVAKSPAAKVDVARSRQMSLIKGRDTKVELRVRRALHSAGLRYRLHVRNLPGKPDVVLRSRSTVIFVHGCFWHRHPDPNCSLARLPKTHRDFWVPKLKGNRARDLRVKRELEDSGWRVIEIWECQSHDQGLADLVSGVKSIPLV